MDLTFVLARRQNHFFVEIVDAIRDELEQAGVASSIHLDSFPPERDDLVYVLVPPHEWFSLEGWRQRPTTGQLARTIFICAEQPDTSFFVDDARLGALAGAVFDINTRSIREFRRIGLSGVRHFPLGWTRSWAHAPLDEDGLPRADVPRDIDVLHLGMHSPPRGLTLAMGARWLAKWRCHLVLGDHKGPNPEGRENFVVGDAKWDLLIRSRVLLNTHVAHRPYFEWLRIVQAICCGCAVVSEHSVGAEPLRSGEHFVAARSEALGLVANGLLRNEDHRALIARQAYDFLRTERPFSSSVSKLVAAAEEIVARRRREGTPRERPLPELTVGPQRDPGQGARTAFPSVVRDEDSSVVRAALKDCRLELMQLHRDLDAWRREAAAGHPLAAVEVDRASRAHAAATPRVTVITPLYNHEHHVEAALESVVRGRYEDVELVIVEDGSTDGSLAAGRRFIAAHEGVPALLVHHPVNRGLGPARNTGLDFARGEFAFLLDSDNGVYRHCLERLVEALDAAPDAVAAYGMLAMFSKERALGLRSVWQWNPERFRTGNFIDAMALWRTRALREFGGYTADTRLHGLEDYDLWCRLAEAGGRAELVPEIVARYRVTGHSMLSLTDISIKTAVSVLIERYPRLMAGVDPPL